MPSTRRSLPAAGPAPSSTLARVAGAEMSAKQKREAKRLNIDAKAGIVGDLKEVKKSEGGSEGGSEGKREVYHYRGAVYMIKGDEPEEWLQQEPERFRSKKRKVSEVDGEGEVESKEGVGQVNERERKKRKVGNVEAATKGEVSVRAITTSSTPSKKRKISTTNNSKMDVTATVPTERKRSSDDTDEAATDPRPRKQARATATTSAPAPPPPTRQTNPKQTKPRRPHPIAQEQRRTAHAEKMRLDFTVNGGHDSISTSQARREAIAKGYQVLPLPQNALDEGRTYRRESAGEALEGFMRKLVGLNGEIKRIEGARRELEGRRADREKGGNDDADGKVRRTGVNVVELPAFAARKAAFLARRDSGLGSSSPPPPADTPASENKETFSQDRAEEVLRQGRMIGESFQERDARFERERGLLDELFAKGQRGG
ncbi:hypothetical protein LTR78_009693 [Recurvomyces mirabilis]|uniref:Uncharacterized protein n=2 Tax=Recurvomyces mirabilis TaxID=574656 RepID=A0AAE0TRF3_9PEZI|nr:hypothetical protein LTR78_009693 [Recurvomyces mirabilis]